MSNQPDVTVRLDDRIRLMAAALAATDYPEQAQERKRHGTHAHARATTKRLKDYKQHPAIVGLQSLLDQNAPVEAMYTLIMHCSWPDMKIKALPRWAPPGWNQHLRDFYEDANLAQWWQDEQLVWKRALTECQQVFETVHFTQFLRPFVGDIKERFVFSPNLAYPTDHEIGIRVGQELFAITPPPLAWGDSPPWPYNEETMLTHSYRAALTQYGRLLLIAYLKANAAKVAEASQKELPVSDQFKAAHPSWEDQFVTLFVAAAVALYLEEYVSEAEAKAYMLLERKARGMTILPGTVSVLQRYLQEYGKKYQSFVDFLPVFPKQLRVAKRIVML